jgi:AcrR family transcriptional regulator
MPDEPRPTRDRDATERRILDAARAVLATSGSEGFGINAVARQAGCDKQLIYRYFGGVGGLVDAIGKDIASWWADRLRPLEALGRPDSYAELMQRLGLSVLQALRDDPLMRQIVMWELTSNSDQVQRLARARSVALQEWMQRVRGDLVPPQGLDAAAINAVILAAIQHLVLAGTTAGSFAGLPLSDEADWERMRSTLKRVISALYA